MITIKTTIKTITFMIMMQLISGNLIASPSNIEVTGVDSSRSEAKTRPGDGKDKYNPHSREGESLKGYFYRVYGDQRVLAKNVKFKGPFKRKKVKKFLKKCQKKDGYISEVYTKVQEKKTIETGYGGDETILVHHIALKTKVECLVDGKRIASRKWSAVYLDSDKNSEEGTSVYVDYDDCDADDRAFLAIGEYSIHYDQNPECRADLFTIS